MKFMLSELLSIYKPEQLNDFLKKYANTDLEDNNIFYENIKNNWTCVGDTKYNLSAINMLKDSGKGLIERITNGIDAVLEKEKEKYGVISPKTSDDIVKVAFPHYYENKLKIKNGEVDRQNACETANKVVIAINDSTKSNRPTIDVVDQGCGIDGNKFGDTILSIHKGNKSTTDKNYLIGAFGQGGSTSLPFSFATIIVSKKNNNIYFTIVKKCLFADMKMDTYLYFTPNGKVSLIENDNFDYVDDYIKTFVNSESGTLIRMIDMEIAREYRVNDVAKPGMLGDFINTELYNVSLPVKVIENRDDFTSNVHKQNRYSYGSNNKMMTWEYARKEYFGTISIEHNCKEYKINYYFILPPNEIDWAKDVKCKEIFKQINVHLDPIIYTVNGQYISSERFTKLKNAGLSFLQYRLLVDINLDVLGKDKYRFFTTDRSRIQDSDLTNGFLDKVIEALKNEKTIIDMNNYIASQSVNSNIDNDLINDISNNVKCIYNKFLKSGNKSLKINKGIHTNSTPEDIYYDSIQKFEITTSKQVFYKNENINIVVTTNAKKSVNDKAKIYMFVDGKQNYNHSESVMNGRIQYTINNIPIGMHNIQFDLYDDNLIFVKRSNTFEFAVVDELKKEVDGVTNNKDLDLKINLVDDKELIIDIVKNEVDKSINIYLCLNHELLVNNLYGKSANNDEIQVLKNKLLEPIILFTLFLGKNYDNIEDIKKKNELILSFCNTFYITNKLN